MDRVSRFVAAVGFGLVLVTAAAAAEDGSRLQLAPLPAPRDITEVFLRFHQEELCRGVDAVFDAGDGVLKVWCLVRDGGSHRKLLQMLEPLSGSVRVETYSAYPVPVEKDPDEDDQPPPSLWENSRLRDFILAPLLRPSMLDDPDMPHLISPEAVYPQRLRLFARQVLERSGELERYGSELPVLARLALDSSVDADLRSLAGRVGLRHSEKLGKLASELGEDLRQAIPSGSDGPEPVLQGAPRAAGDALTGLADRISERARSVARRVHLFIYPERHTVELDELRNPDLMVALEELSGLAAEYLDGMRHLTAGP